jgi:hypothetical protein
VAHKWLLPDSGDPAAKPPSLIVYIIGELSMEEDMAFHIVTDQDAATICSIIQLTRRHKVMFLSFLACV